MSCNSSAEYCSSSPALATTKNKVDPTKMSVMPMISDMYNFSLRIQTLNIVLKNTVKLLNVDSNTWFPKARAITCKAEPDRRELNPRSHHLFVHGF